MSANCTVYFGKLDVQQEIQKNHVVYTHYEASYIVTCKEDLEVIALVISAYKGPYKVEENRVTEYTFQGASYVLACRDNIAVVIDLQNTNGDYNIEEELNKIEENRKQKQKREKWLDNMIEEHRKQKKNN